ncbi:helix-turn-helix DNA binding domain protein [Gordonia phage Stormageddon]|uniref:Helix-turn-helix DNA binding domain protein n=1 Tax=Gordonia phage Stormageddon TaxID=2656541 RepID=A0A649VR50_9CAUD|nr:helix-turn-helix DNA binding domain protein [Gordonia phage Stormageddon]QGJ94946.1 helix-turn-helix DNA binding domain protein [Gordonia phage Stormageddon]
MSDSPDISGHKLRQLRSAAAKEGNLDKAVVEEIANLTEEHRLYVFRPETRCRVCNSDSAAAVNKMLAHAFTYTDILRTLEPVNNVLPDDLKITYSSIWNHAKRHFPIEETANAVYRRIVEKRAEEMEVDFVKGVNGALTPLAYLEVMMYKGYESMVDTDTVINPVDGARAAEKLAQLTREINDQSGDMADTMVKFERLVEAVKSSVPERYWQIILDALDDTQGGYGSNVLDAEVEEIEAAGYDPGDPDLIPDDPGLDDGRY